MQVFDIQWTGAGEICNKFLQRVRGKFSAHRHENLAIISDQKNSEDSRNEVLRFQSILSNLGYTLTDVVRNKPTHKDSLEKLKEIALHICKLGIGERFLHENPMSCELKELIGGDQTILEKYRPYLCALVIVYACNFPVLSKYIGRTVLYEDSQSYSCRCAE